MGSPNKNLNTDIDISCIRPSQTIHFCFNKSIMNHLGAGEFTLIEDSTIKALLYGERKFTLPTTNLCDMINIYFFVRRRIYKECYKYPINKLKKELSLGGDKIYDCLRVLEANELLYLKQFYNKKEKHDDSYFQRKSFSESYIPSEIKEINKYYR